MLDVAAVVDDARDVGIAGGRELIALARASTQVVADRSALDAVAEQIGMPAALDAVAVAANFQIMNRVVDATGLPIGRKHRANATEIIEALGLDAFPHAAH